MKKISLILLVSFFALPSWSATPEELDELLLGIEQDIAAIRLSSPVGNNALEKIQTFRKEAPFDFRVVPLTYRWGSVYVSLANSSLTKGDYNKAQEYADKVWPVAALTPGLESLQLAIDEARGSSSSAPATVEQQSVSKEDLERQRKLADAAALEKQRLKKDAERQKQEDAARKAEEARKAAQDKARREEQERLRRAALAAKSQPEPKLAAPKQLSDKNIDDIDLDDLGVSVVTPVPPVRPVAVKKEPVVNKGAVKPRTSKPETTAALWSHAQEDSTPLANFDIPVDKLKAKDRDIAESMGNICQKMVEDNASLVIHTADKSDYRWLAVRLTLCARRVDRAYRLRHSFQSVPTGKNPFVTLHPPRDASLLEGATN